MPAAVILDGPIEAGQQQQIVHQLALAFAGPIDQRQLLEHQRLGPHQGLAMVEAADHGTDRCQRLAQFVGNIGAETHQLLDLAADRPQRHRHHRLPADKGQQARQQTADQQPLTQALEFLIGGQRAQGHRDIAVQNRRQARSLPHPHGLPDGQAVGQGQPLALSAIGWLWLDAFTALAVGLVVMAGAWRLLREAMAVNLDAAPRHIALEQVRRALLDLPGVVAVEELHVWGLSTSRTALTAHILRRASPSPDADAFLQQAQQSLEQLGISKSTLQLQTADSRQQRLHSPGAR